VTGGGSSLVGIPTEVGPWTALAAAAVTIYVAYVFQSSHVGLMLRASRDDEIAAKASAVDVITVRIVAFVLSAFFVGVGGGLYAQFLGILTVDMFYLNMTIITLTMLVVGGIGSLTGARRRSAWACLWPSC
jgi:branched-chain amino acid transport system permease protein